MRAVSQWLISISALSWGRCPRASKEQQSSPGATNPSLTQHSTQHKHHPLDERNTSTENVAGLKSRGTCYTREILTPCPWDSFTQDMMSCWLSDHAEDKVWSGKTPLSPLLEKGSYPGHSLRGTGCISADHYQNAAQNDTVLDHSVLPPLSSSS